MKVGVPLPDAPVSLADRRVFTSHGVVFTVADVARLGRRGDRESGCGGLSAEQVQIDFRRARRLLTADRLVAWLDSWMIEPEDFVTWTQAVADGQVQDTWCALVCSGAFDAASAALVSAVAAAHDLRLGPDSAATFDPDGWVDRLTTATTTESAVRAMVQENRLGWTRIAASLVTAPSRGACAELRQRLVADQVELADAALEARCSVDTVDTDIEKILPAALRPYLAGAAPGDIMGPVETPNGWTLAVVHERSEPDPREPSVRTRAAGLVGADAVARAVARHIGT